MSLFLPRATAQRWENVNETDADTLTHALHSNPEVHYE